MSSYSKWLKGARARVAAALEGREEVPAQEPFVEAWIAYALHLSMRNGADEPVALQEIITYADGINKASPSQNELAWGLVRIKKRGWLRVEGGNFALTAEARATIEEVTNLRSGVTDPREGLQAWLATHPL